MNNKNTAIYYESKTFNLVISIIILVVIVAFLATNGVLLLLPIPILMLIVVLLYPSAKITIKDEGLEYKKGRKNITVGWSEVMGVHQDPVFSPNPISFYLSNKFRMGGFFIETSEGFTDYIGAVGDSIWSINPMKREELIGEIERRASVSIKTGAVSILKQKQKFWDITLVFAAIFIVPVLIIGAYGIYAYLSGDEMLKFLIFGR